ncbi:MAG: hypothetical protein M3065_01200 [Actinomycetota bacterium]|nr:hypothetical protein [Actinomycetota bacterium]
MSDRRSSDDLANHPDADDRAIEALLAAAQTQCTAHQLASGLRWALPRTIQALERLDENDALNWPHCDVLNWPRLSVRS